MASREPRIMLSNFELYTWRSQTWSISHLPYPLSCCMLSVSTLRAHLTWSHSCCLLFVPVYIHTVVNKKLRRTQD